jgi:hypothetical protein
MTGSYVVKQKGRIIRLPVVGVPVARFGGSWGESVDEESPPESIWVNKEPAGRLVWVFGAGMGVGRVNGGMREPAGWLFGGG